MTEEEARRKAGADLAVSIASEAFAGVLSGGIGGGMQGVYQGFKNKRAGDDINYRGNTKELIDKGLMAPEGSRTYENAKEAAEKFRDNEKAPSEEGAGEAFSIETLPDGRKYVQATEQVIHSEDKNTRSYEIMNYINNKVRNGEDMKIELDNGEAIYITGRTAWKMGDQGNLGNDFYLVKGNAAGVIDEIVQTSKKFKTKPAMKEHSGGFGKDGWDYRSAYFRDLDGKYYRLELSVGITEDMKEAYNIGKIEETTFPGNPVTGSKAQNGKSSLHSNSIAPKGDAVNTQYMQNGGEYSVHNRNNNSVKPMEVGNLYNSMLQEGYITPEEGERYRGVSLRVRQSGEAVGANEVQIAEAERMSRATGREVIFLGGNNDIIGADGKAYTLQGRAKDGVIYVNPNNGTYISNQVLAEEFIHSIEGTESYKEFVTFISELAENTEDIDAEAERAEIKQIYDGAGVEYNLDREFTAQMAAKLLFNDAESVEYLVKNRQSVAGRFFDFLSHYSAKLTGNDEKATVLQARRLLSKALRESEEMEEAGNGWSLSKNAEAEVQAALNRVDIGGEIKLTDTTPSIMLGHDGVKNLPMTMKASHIRENVFTEAEAKAKGLKVDKSINYHGLGEKLFLQIIEGLDDVTVAYRGTKNADDPSRRENYFLLISQYNFNGDVVNVPVYINEKGLYHNAFIDVNKIATAFGRSGLQDYINREIKKGNLVRIKKKNTQASESTSPINADYGMDVSKNSIARKSDAVNTQYMQKGGSYSIARKSGATMEEAQKLFNDLTYNGELTDTEKLREIYKESPELFGMLRDVVVGERSIAEEGILDYAAPYDEALFIMGLVEDSKGYTSEEVAESIEAAGWQVEDINKDGLLLDAEYAIICSENAHDVCGEIVRGINRLVPGAFGYSAEEISEIKSIWQRAYNDPEEYTAELEAKKAEADKWNVPENGETVSERAETSIEKSLKKHMGIEEGEKTPHPPQAVPLPLEGKAQKSVDEVTAEMTAQHREKLKTKSKADFDALKGTDKLKAAGVTGITGSVGLYGHTEQAIEQKQGVRETKKAIREVERVLSPDEIKFAKLVNRKEIDAKYIPDSLRRDLSLELKSFPGK